MEVERLERKPAGRAYDRIIGGAQQASAEVLWADRILAADSADWAPKACERKAGCGRSRLSGAPTDSDRR